MSLSTGCLINKKDWKQFLKLPGEIYRDNSHWVPPVSREVRNTLHTEKHPFWEHARREVFLVRKDDKVAGRVVAIVDDNHINFHGENTGFFGFFECIEDFEVARLLWDQAKRWLRHNGMDLIRGPLSPSMNDECGFLLDGFDKPPTVMMPYTQPYYLEFAERYGFQKAKDLYAFYKKVEDGIPQRIRKMVERIKKKTGVIIRPLAMNGFERDIQHLKDIYNSAWEKNWGFVPMTDKEIDLVAKKLKYFAEPELVLFAEIDNEPIGVSVTIPDINYVLKRLNGKLGPIEILKFLRYKRKIEGVRSLIGGVKKEYRNTGIIAVLSYETEKAAQRLGYKWGELGWNLEDNDLINRFDTAIGGKIYKKYRIYEMPI
jgi:GNAT superfamily N-acetyltransferase